jgi:hypothetical protein
MGVDSVILMEVLSMAVCAVDLIGIIQADGDGSAHDVVVLSLMAVRTQEIVLSHVDIDGGRREVEGFIQVTVLDSIATPAVEVAGTAVLACRLSHTAGDFQEIHTLDRDPGIAFHISACVVMANQAVNILLTAEIEISIFPPVTGVAGSAGGPVSLDTDAEIIEGVLLAHGDNAVPVLELIRLTFPGPMDGGHHFLGGVRVTFQAGAGDVLTGFIRALNDIGMVRVGNVQRDVFPGVVTDRSLPPREKDRQGSDDQSGDQGDTEQPAKIREFHGLPFSINWD